MRLEAEKRPKFEIPNQRIVLFAHKLTRVVSKMVSRFPTEEEILAVYEADVPTMNTKKTTKFGLAVFTNTVLL